MCAGHLFEPLLTRGPNPRFLYGPFPVGDMDWPLSGWGYGLAPFRLGIWTGPFPVGDMDRPLSSWGYGLGGIGHTLRICLDSCGIGVWLGTSGVAALMSCSSPCLFGCISRNFAFKCRSVTGLMDHGTLFRLMFGLIKATRPPHKMEERMRQICALCCPKRSITACGECQEHYCDECIDAKTCGEQVVYEPIHEQYTLMLKFSISPYAACFVGKVCGPLWSSWRGRVNPGLKLG